MRKLILCIYLFAILSLSAFDIYAEETITVPPVSYSANFIQMMVGLFFIVFMIFGVVWAMKKVGYKGYSDSNLIKIKSCLPISPKEKILLIQVGEEQILIGSAPGFIGHIKTIEKPVEIPSDKAGSKNYPVSSAFADKLKSIINKNEMVE